MSEKTASAHLTQSLDDVKALLHRWVFESKEPVVVALKGGWGEGKTFFWKNSVAGEYTREQVGYASVFGADSLQAIRERVLLAALPKVPADSTSTVGKVSEVIRQAAPAILRKF